MHPSRPSPRASRTPRAEHEAAVARRLELLGRELAAVRPSEPVTMPAPVAVPVPLDDDHTRVRRPAPARPLAAAPHPPPATPLLPAVPATVPRPGRHASRRAGGTWLPEPLRGRVALGPGPLAVVAVLVALGLAVTAWWAVRSEPTTVVPTAPAAEPATTDLAAPGTPAAPAVPGGGTSGAETGGGTGGETGGEAGGTVTVDVAGKVRRPGIVVLDAGSRVVDALREAGGARPGVATTGLNLARVLVDGEQVVVGQPAAAGLPPATAGSSAGATPGPLVDLNTADLTALESLPEVGPVTAQAIVTWRETNGGFTAVSELLEVDGIGEATLAAISPFVTV